MASAPVVCTMEPTAPQHEASPSSSPPRTLPGPLAGDRSIDDLFDQIRRGLERAEQRKPPHERSRFSYRFDAARSSARASTTKDHADKMETDDAKPRPRLFLFGSQLRDSLLDTSYVPPEPEPEPPKPLAFEPATFNFVAKGASKGDADMAAAREDDGPSKTTREAPPKQEEPSTSSRNDEASLSASRSYLADGVPSRTIKTGANGPQRKRRITLSSDTGLGNESAGGTSCEDSSTGMSKASSYGAIFGQSSLSSPSKPCKSNETMQADDAGVTSNTSVGWGFQPLCLQGSSQTNVFAKTDDPSKSSASQRRRAYRRVSTVSMGTRSSINSSLTSCLSSSITSEILHANLKPSSANQRLAGNRRSSGFSLNSSMNSTCLSSSFVSTSFGAHDSSSLPLLLEGKKAGNFRSGKRRMSEASDGSLSD